MKEVITLLDNNGTLYLDDKKVLIYFYDSGDVDTIKTKNPNMDQLFSALYCEREMGNIPSYCNSVFLPCGKKVEF